MNEKIEGFYEVCKLKGLSGDQGVVIPSSNVGNLMLKEEIIDAMNQDLFHIFPVTHVSEGIEILTGIKFGEKGSTDKYEDGSINKLIQNRLNQFAIIVKEYETVQ